MLVGAAALLIACGGGGGRPATTAGLGAPNRHVLDVVPDGVLDVTYARPSELLADAALGELLAVVVPPQQRDAFEQRFFVPLDRVDELVIATTAASAHDGEGDAGGAGQAARTEGFVMVLRGRFSARDAVVSLGLRMNTVEVAGDDPPRRAGFLGTERREAIAVDASTFVFSGRAGPTIARLAEQLREAPRPTLASELYARMDRAPAFHARLVPLNLPRDTALGVLFAEQRALGVGLRREGQDVVGRVHLVGAFPPGVEANLLALVRSLARTDLGRVVGADPSRATARAGEGFAELVVPLSIAPLAHGLRTIFIDEIPELFPEP